MGKGFESLSIKDGSQDRKIRSHALPIYASSAFEFDSLEHGIAIFTGEEEGYVYGRYGNPTLYAVAAKIAHLDHLPQGKIESDERVVKMVRAMDQQGFGNCSNTEACEAVCPQEISVDHIARMNWRYNLARVKAFGRLK